MSDAKKHPVLCDCGHERDNGVHCGHDGEAECTVAGCGCEEFHARPVLTAREAVERLREALDAVLALPQIGMESPFGDGGGPIDKAIGVMDATADLAPEPVTDEDVHEAREAAGGDWSLVSGGVENSKRMRAALEADRARVAERAGVNRG